MSAFLTDANLQYILSRILCDQIKYSTFQKCDIFQFLQTSYVNDRFHPHQNCLLLIGTGGIMH